MSITKIQNDDSIGVAIAGLGFGESVHLNALKTNSNLKPLALWHPNQEKLKTSCKKNKLAGSSDWSEILNDSNVKAVIIATPPEVRFELALQAINAGKHLLLEKPVAINTTQISELQKAAINNQITVAVDFEYRAVPLFMQAKKLLSEKVVGTPWLIKFDWLMSSRANPSRPWNWYSEAEKGGGVLGALGTHAFDILHWLIGPTISISGLLSTAISERINPLTGDLTKVTSEDVVLAQLELGGITGNHLIPTHVNLSAVTRNGRGCWLEIYGSEGTLILGSDNQSDYVHGFGLWIAKPGEKPQKISPDPSLIFPTTWSDGRIAPVARLQEWWGYSIKERKPMIPGLAEGLESQKVCELLKDASLSGQRILIN